MNTLSTGQVVIYSDAKFSGRSRPYGVGDNQHIDVPNSDGLSPVGNDAISSVKVGKGVKLEFYSDNGYRGDRLTLFEGNYPHLADWNDRVTGLKIEKVDPVRYPVVMFYVDNNIGSEDATCHGLSIGDYPNSSELLKNDSYTLIDVPDGVDVTVYQNSNYGGESQTFSQKGIINLSQYGFNDRTSSIKIRSHEYALTKVEFDTPITLDVKPEETIDVRAVTSNETSDSEVTTSLTIEKTVSASVTSTKEHSQTYGLTVTVGSSVSIEGLASVERSIAINVEQVFTTSEAKTETTEQKVSCTTSVTVKNGKEVEGRLVVTPVTKQYDVTYTYQKVDKDKQIVPGGKTIVDKGKVIIKYSSEAKIKVIDIKPSSTQQ